MSDTTKIYNLHIMNEGDKLWPGYDRLNMKTIDNQISGLMRFVGSGILSGWEIMSMALPAQPSDPIYNQVMTKRHALINANIKSETWQQYLRLGSPTEYEEDIWRKVIVVTPGDGIIGLYHGMTTLDAFILLPDTPGLYNIWAEPSVCLATEHLGIITYTNSIDDAENTETRIATYLGTVETQMIDIDRASKLSVVNIITTDRNNLNNLQGELEKSLRKYYYRHVHAGLSTTPAKIVLNTIKILLAEIPIDQQSVTSFLLLDDEGNYWQQGTSDNYGTPNVYLNDVLLSPEDYYVNLSEGKIYLQNSLAAGSILQVVLPLAAQIILTPININSGGPIQLSEDSVEVYKWDANNFKTPIVYYKNTEVDSNIYTINPETGIINFVPGSIDLSNAVNSDLVVVIKELVDQIEGILDGARTANINASSFSKGILSSNRFGNLDHVGQIRYKEEAKLSPYLRLLGYDNNTDYSPEIVGSPLQYNSFITCIYYSRVIGTYLVGTRNGLLSTTDFISFATVSSWTPDMGTPIKITDNILKANGECHFKNSYILTEDGHVYITKNLGVSWLKLKLPKIAVSNNATITPFVTSFIATTDRIYNEKYSKYYYYTVYYLGTKLNGMWSAYFVEGTADKKWQWERVRFGGDDTISTINAIEEISTLNTTTTKFGTVETIDSSIYMSMSNDSADNFYASIKSGSYSLLYQNTVIEEIYCIQQGDAINNLIWREDNQAWLTHIAEKTTDRDEQAETTHIYWKHPFEVATVPVVLTPLDSQFHYSKIVEMPDFYEYWILHDGGIYAISDKLINAAWVTADNSNVVFSSSAKDVFLDSANERVLLGSDKGIWESDDRGLNWFRNHKEFTLIGSNISMPSVYNIITGQKMIVSSISEAEQSIVLSEPQDIWARFVYERDYTTYYVKPWNANSDVIVYENNRPTSAAYLLTPDEGKITFSAGRLPSSIIKITIVHQGAFISNVGKTPHEELDNILLVQESPATTLATDVLPLSTEFTVSDPNAIPEDIVYLEFRQGESFSLDVKTERIKVYPKGNGKYDIVGIRNTVDEFLAGTTQIYIVKLVTSLGIEDQLSIITSEQPYHLSSLTGTDILQLTLKMKEIMQSQLVPIDLFGNVKLPNALIVGGDEFDTAASSDNPYIGIEPDNFSDIIPPSAIYAIENASETADQMRVYTNKGVWIYENNGWKQEYTFDRATNVYFLNISSDKTVIGTNNGVYTRLNNTWGKNITYPDVTYDYITSTWFKGTSIAYAKNNGIAFVWEQTDKPFLSDAYSGVDGINVYGLFKSYYLTVDENGEKTKNDIMYLCTENGFHGITNGDSTSQYNTFLTGKELFGVNKLMHTNSAGESIPVKIYKVYQNLENGKNRKEVDTEIFKTLILLTNNGIYRVRNWRWGGFGPDSVPFAIDGGGPSLIGQSCYCFVNRKCVSSTGVEYYQMFVGTNKGVYSSIDDGASWQACERINYSETPVYDLQEYVANNISVILAATVDGLYFSIDGGDNWAKPEEGNVNADYSSVISSSSVFAQDQQYVQNFTVGSSDINVNKISLLIGLESQM